VSRSTREATCRRERKDCPCVRGAGGLQDGERPADVDRVRFVGNLDGAIDAHGGRMVEDDVDALIDRAWEENDWTEIGILRRVS
jgi:hypothetical protein